MLASQSDLQLLVGTGKSGIPTKCVAKCDHPVPVMAAIFNDMNQMGSGVALDAAAENMIVRNDIAPGVVVADAFHRSDTGQTIRKMLHADQYVDDRFCLDPGNSGAADVLYVD